jgi:diguanylate cyclase (GGDEF)-like protein
MSLRTRITIGFVLLLAAVQGIGFVLVNQANHRAADARVAHDLDAGVRVFAQLIEHQSRELTHAARLLAADFGFREAVATRDVATIDSVLANHGERVGASVMTLLAPDGTVLADTLNRASVGRLFPLHALVDQARRDGSASAILVLENRPYHLVVVPVNAPRLIAWVALGFAIDDRTARTLRMLTDLEVTFIGSTPGKAWQAYASTLGVQARARVLDSFARTGHLAVAPGDPLLGQYVGRDVSLEGGRDGTVSVVLQRSLSDVLTGFDRLRGFLALLAFASLGVSILASILIARGITRPLSRLATSAAAMREGDYTVGLDVDRGDEIGVLARSLDHMRESVAAREGKILKLAYEDVLTGLPNRARFNALLAEAVDAARARSGACAIAILGIDRFKRVNETLGHESGDRVLAEVGERLRAACRARDVVARLGGDEYALLLTDVSESQALELVRHAQSALERPVAVGDCSVDAHAAAGVAWYPAHGGDAGTLLRHADAALYAAKRSNLPCASYDPSYDTSREAHLSLLGELQGAVERDELRIFYQPKVDLTSGRTTAVEALVRWQHPARGFVPPGDFIPFAEQTGYIRLLTRWVLQAAVTQCRDWHRRGIRLKVAVNLSARELIDPELPAMVARKLSRIGLDAQWLCLEVTESGVMDDPAVALATLKQLDELGVSLSLDDYGTGYSSLAYLKKLPVDQLKIDRSFVMHMATDPDDLVIVRSTIDLAHNLGLTVVAEGAEDAATVDALRSLGCDKVQGWYFAKAMPVEQLEAWLRDSPHGLGPTQPAPTAPQAAPVA